MQQRSYQRVYLAAVPTVYNGSAESSIKKKKNLETGSVKFSLLICSAPH
jgi:hypothetical protein